MRLAFFDFNINYGGGPQGTVYLANRLSADNKVHIVDAYGACNLYCESIRQAGIPLHILHQSAKRVFVGNKGKPLARISAAIAQVPEFWKLRAALTEELLEIDPHVVWVNNEKSLILLASCYRLRRYPLVMYVRYWARPEQVSFSLRWLLKHKVAAIIAHAKATISQLEQQGIAKQKLHFVPNSVDTWILEQQAKQPLGGLVPGLGMWPKILLPAARPTLEKGHMTAVKAVSHLKKKGYNPALWLPGKVPVGVGPAFVEKLKNIINELNLKDNIFFLGWRQDIPALVNACDVVILPTHTEGFPRVILEAMLLRRPVCATPVGGIPEAIEDRKTGWLFDVGNHKVLAEKIEQLISQPAVTKVIVEQAYDLAKREFNPDKHTRAVMNVFEMVANLRK